MSEPSKQFIIWESQDCRVGRRVSVHAESGHVVLTVGDWGRPEDAQTIKLNPAYARSLIEGINACLDHLWRNRNQ